MRRLVAVLALALITSPAASALGGKKPKPKATTCSAGQARLVLGKKTNCVAPAQTLAAPSGHDVTASTLSTFAIDMGLSDPFTARLVPKKARPSRTNLHKVFAGVSEKLPSALGTFATRAITFGPGQTTSTNHPDGSSSSSSSSTMSDDDTGSTGNTKVDAEQSSDGSTSVSIDISMFDKGGAGGSFSVTMPITRESAKAAKCPTADGSIDRDVSDHIATRSHQTKPGFGVSFVDQSMRYQDHVTLKGHVDPNAALSSTDYTGTSTLSLSYEAKILGGLIHPDVQVEFAVTTSGTISASGARSVAETTITARGRQRGLSAAAASAAVAKLLQDQDLRDKLTQLISDNIDTAYRGLKTAETGWQVPNACAVMHLSPVTGPTGIGKDQSTTFTGLIGAASGGNSDGRWSLQQLDAGRQSGLPGSSSPSAPISVTLTATTDVDPNTVAAGVKVRATSRAGVAELSWSAGGKADPPPYYYRIVGGSATQTVSGSRITQSGFKIDNVAPLQYTWNFSQTTGTPDGKVAKDGKLYYGSVSAGDDQVSQPSWIWRTTEDGGHHHSVPAITWPGPSVTFDSNDNANPDSVTVAWNDLGVPLIQYSATDGASDGIYNTLGPECFAGHGDLNTDTLPASFFAQRSFTLAIDKDWHVDKTNTFGHDVCTGHLTGQMTIERVQADGSALP